MSNGTSDGEAAFRAKLGLYLVIGSSAGVLLLGMIVIIAAGFKGGAADVKDTAQLLFTGLLPLLGTWVGTILAFYYSKENFESASRGTLDIVRSVSERLKSTPVANKMVRADAIVKASIPENKQIDDLPLKDIRDLFEKLGANGEKISRLIFVDAKGLCVGILHRSIWMEMLNLGEQQRPAIDIQVDNLGKLLVFNYESRIGGNFKEFITRTLAFVAEDRTVADAKTAMEAKPQCQDVIVTATGKADEPMRGWISNVDIMRLSLA
jgi:hypothetical protein